MIWLTSVELGNLGLLGFSGVYYFDVSGGVWMLWVGFSGLSLGWNFLPKAMFSGFLCCFLLCFLVVWV